MSEIELVLRVIAEIVSLVILCLCLWAVPHHRQHRDDR